ncbi:Ppx/GppA family phosphatase [Streptomyces sp. AJS327]|uniref:Ppx/GppA phosphatase family protein n=1 Tax=Streptomyces sp. AJS327 TaxID=2545265 RepID=UPI0015DEB1FD|nr:Ppx/GppA phosphatase family protein [Streptomyces sp. AJS327]MBA0049416.1 Ppx/GppA family phosphatase [Streptomyces sp. AJS327]
MSARVAAIDCGTNSIRLLVAETGPTGPGGEPGELRELDRRMRIVRLGEGVDRTGRFAPEALERTFTACREYAGVIGELGAERLRFVATSASRDVRNRDEFTHGVRDILGVEPEVITGAREAEFSFTGATRGLGGEGFARPYLVTDIGGGSTEFVVGDTGVRAAHSVDIGCVRLTERHLTHRGEITDLPTAAQIEAVRADVTAALDEVERTVPITEAHTLVGLAGTVTTIGGIALDLAAYDSAAIHHSRVSRQRVEEITHRLLTSTHEERAAIPVMHPGRVDVINAGALVLLSVMERAGAEEVVVSEHDILDGVAIHTALDA